MPTWPKAIDPAYRGEAYEEAIVPKGLVELRVHGVNGGTPERNLDDPNPTQVAGDETAGFYRRRKELASNQQDELPPKAAGDSEGDSEDDGSGTMTSEPSHPDQLPEPRRTVEAFNWSSINTKKKGRARWIWLFAFAAVNLAGYLLPKPPPRWDALSDGERNALSKQRVRRSLRAVLKGCLRFKLPPKWEELSESAKKDRSRDAYTSAVRRAERKRSTAQLAIRLVALVTTVALVLGVAPISIDLIGVQCGGSSGCTDRFWLGWLASIVEFGDGELAASAIKRAVVFTVGPLLALLALWAIGRRSAAYEDYGSPVVGEGWKSDGRNPRMDDVRMRELAFWQAPDPVYIQGWLHTTAGIAVTGLVLAYSLRELTLDGTTRHDALGYLGWALWAVLGVAALGVVLSHWLQQIPRRLIRKDAEGWLRPSFWLFVLSAAAIVGVVARRPGDFEALDWVLVVGAAAGLLWAVLARGIERGVLRPIWLPSLLAFGLTVAVAVVGWHSTVVGDEPPLEAIRNGLIWATVIGMGLIALVWAAVRYFWLLVAITVLGAAAFFVGAQNADGHLIEVDSWVFLAAELALAVVAAAVVTWLGARQESHLGEAAARKQSHHPAVAYVGLALIAVAGIGAGTRDGNLWLAAGIPLAYLFGVLAILARTGQDHPAPEEMRGGVAAVLAGLALTSVLTVVSGLTVFVSQRLGSDVPHTEGAIPTSALVSVGNSKTEMLWDADAGAAVLTMKGTARLASRAVLLEEGAMVRLDVDLDAVPGERLKRTDRGDVRYEDHERYVTSGTVLLRDADDLVALGESGADVAVVGRGLLFLSASAEIRMVDGMFTSREGAEAPINEPFQLESVLAIPRDSDLGLGDGTLDGANLEIRDGLGVVTAGVLSDFALLWPERELWPRRVVRVGPEFDLGSALVELDDFFAVFEGRQLETDPILIEFRQGRMAADGTTRIFYPAEVGWYSVAAVGGFLVFLATILFRFFTLFLFRWSSPIGSHRRWGKGQDLSDEYDHAADPSAAVHDLESEERKRDFAAKAGFRRLLANLIDDIDWVLSVAVFTTFGLIITILVARSGDAVPTGGEQDLITLATVAVAFVWVFVYALVRQAGDDGALRRQFGMLWDVTSFFPRRFHPLAPPCYAERSVIDIRDRIIHIRSGNSTAGTEEPSTRDERKVVIVAHSAGTLLVSVALLTLMDDEEKRDNARAAAGDDFLPSGLERREGHPTPSGWELDGVALVTYGCMLRRIFGRAWPDQLPLDDLKDLKARLGDGDSLNGGFPRAPRDKVPRWVNFGRHTDYLGGRVFAELQQMPTRYERLPERTLLYPERTDDVFFTDPARRWRYEGQLEHARMWTHSFNYQSDTEDHRFRDHIFRIGWAMKGHEKPLPHPVECGCHPAPSAFLQLTDLDDVYDRMLRLAWVPTLDEIAASDAAELRTRLEWVRDRYPEFNTAPSEKTIETWIAEAGELV